MSKNIRKSLCICAATLLLGGIVAPSISNYSVSAHRRHHITRVRKYHRSRKSRRARKNKISYRTYKYNLRKYNQYQHNLKKARRSFNHYKKLLHHKHSGHLMRRYTNSKRYWQKQIKRLTKSSYRYQRVIKQYKSGNSSKIIINYPHNNKRNIVPKKYRKYKKPKNTNVRVIKPKVHKLEVHHKSHYVKRNLADATHKYVLSTNDMVNDNGLKNILNDKGYRYGGGSIGDLVHIVNQKTIDGKTFDYIKDPDGYDNNKWIYDGELSDNSSDSAQDISLNNLEHNIITNYINDNADTFKQELKNQTLQDINNDRASNGENALSENPQWDQIAQMRAKQIRSDFNHYPNNNKNYEAYAVYDAHQLDVPINEWAENIARPQIGSFHIYPNFVSNHKSYDNRNGYDLADCAEDEMMNYDVMWESSGDFCNNGHRDNILDPHAKFVGIGVYHHPNDDLFYLAEDFGYNNDIPDNDNTNNYNSNGNNNFNYNYSNNNGDNDQLINDNGNGNNAGGNGTQTGGNGTQGNNGIYNNQANNSSNPNNSYNGNNSDNPNNNNNNDINNYDYSDGNNNTILSNSDGAVIDHGSNNTINAKGSVIVNGYNNTINSRGIVIANGYNNTVNAKKTIWNDTNTNDGNYQDALANGVAINASNMNGQNISK